MWFEAYVVMLLHWRVAHSRRRFWKFNFWTTAPIRFCEIHLPFHIHLSFEAVRDQRGTSLKEKKTCDVQKTFRKSYKPYKPFSFSQWKANLQYLLRNKIRSVPSPMSVTRLHTPSPNMLEQTLVNREKDLTFAWQADSSGLTAKPGVLISLQTYKKFFCYSLS